MKDLKSRYLAAIGYVVAGGESPAQAFERLRTTNPDAFPVPRDTQSFLDACAEVVLAYEAETVPRVRPSATDEDLAALFELAAYFQDDYSTKLPVIAAFRRWRSGQLTTEEFLARLRDDDLADVLRIEKVAPMKGLALLNDYRTR